MYCRVYLQYLRNCLIRILYFLSFKLTPGTEQRAISWPQSMTALYSPPFNRAKEKIRFVLQKEKYSPNRKSMTRNIFIINHNGIHPGKITCQWSGHYWKFELLRRGGVLINLNWGKIDQALWYIHFYVVCCRVKTSWKASMHWVICRKSDTELRNSILSKRKWLRLRWELSMRLSQSDWKSRVGEFPITEGFDIWNGTQWRPLRCIFSMLIGERECICFGAVVAQHEMWMICVTIQYDKWCKVVQIFDTLQQVAWSYRFSERMVAT